MALGFVGSVVRLGAYQGNTFEKFAVGQVIIGFATIIFMILEVFIDNTLHISTFLSTMPAGYLIS